MQILLHLILLLENSPFCANALFNYVFFNFKMYSFTFLRKVAYTMQKFQFLFFEMFSEQNDVLNNMGGWNV